MTEVEKLRALLAEARAELHSIEALTVHPGMRHGKDAARLLSVLQRIDAALAEPVGDDFKRGAEAMREAAAAHINANIVGDQTAMILAARIYEKEIRALPIPEDKR
jgi:hypothetical protein